MINRKITVENTLLLLGAEGVGGSRITQGFKSPIEAEAVTRARRAGFAIPDSYSPSGELAIDLIGETNVNGAVIKNGKYTLKAMEDIVSGSAVAHISLDVNGLPERAAAVSGLVNVKPTYGAVSRYGTLPLAPSSDTVSVTTATVRDCRELLKAISGGDEKDPMTLPDTVCPLKKDPAPIKRIGVPFYIFESTDSEIQSKQSELSDALKDIGVEITDIPPSAPDLFKVAHAAHNIVLCSELWGNLSRYDGVRYGRRAEGYGDLRELYVKTRSEGFGVLAKSALLYGSFALSRESVDNGFQKAHEAKAWVKAQVSELLKKFDCILLPACSVPFYTETDVKSGKFTAFKENFYTALPSLCGLPAITFNGIQIVGAPLSDNSLLALAEQLEKAKKGDGGHEV